MTIQRGMIWLGAALLLVVVLWQGDVALTRVLWGTRVDLPLADVDRVEVRVDGDTAPLVLKQITEPAAIARIRAYIEGRPDGWEKTWHTPPVTRVHATFYRGGDVVGWFAAGDRFLQAPSLDGPEAMRDADPAELEELNRLLGVPPESHLGPSTDPYPDHRH